MDSVEKCKTPHVKALTPENYASHSGGISKALLTPCRRVGLARKSPVILKSPCSYINPLFSNMGNPIAVGDLALPQVVHTLLDNSTGNFDTPKRKLVETKSENPAAMKKRLSRNLKTVQVLVRKLGDEEILNVHVGTRVAIEESSEGIPKAEHNMDDDSTGTEVMQPTEKGMQELRQQIKEKEKLVQELKVKQVYQKKHNLDELSELTDRWRVGCQEALRQMLGTLIKQGHNLKMPMLLTQLGIPPSLVRYDLDEDDFD